MTGTVCHSVQINQINSDHILEMTCYSPFNITLLQSVTHSVTCRVCEFSSPWYHRIAQWPKTLLFYNILYFFSIIVHYSITSQSSPHHRHYLSVLIIGMEETRLGWFKGFQRIRGPGLVRDQDTRRTGTSILSQAGAQRLSLFARRANCSTVGGPRLGSPGMDRSSQTS